MPDVTGEQQFLLAASRPIRIEYGTRLWDNNCSPEAKIYDYLTLLFIKFCTIATSYFPQRATSYRHSYKNYRIIGFLFLTASFYTSFPVVPKQTATSVFI